MKTISLEQAVAMIPDGSSLMIGGFVAVGTPERVMDETAPCPFGLIRGGHVGLAILGSLQVDQTGLLANWMIPGKLVPGMGGAMDLVTGAKRVVVAMQHTAKGKSKIVKKCTLPITSARAVDLLVTDLAVIAFPDGHATLMETAPSVSVADVVKATEAELIIPEHVPEMAL